MSKEIWRGTIRLAVDLLDQRRRSVEAANSYRGGRVTQVGQFGADLLRQAADSLWALRDEDVSDYEALTALEKRLTEESKIRAPT